MSHLLSLNVFCNITCVRPVPHMRGNLLSTTINNQNTFHFTFSRLFVGKEKYKSQFPSPAIGRRCLSTRKSTAMRTTVTIAKAKAIVTAKVPSGAQAEALAGVTTGSGATAGGGITVTHVREASHHDLITDHIPHLLLLSPPRSP